MRPRLTGPGIVLVDDALTVQGTIGSESVFSGSIGGAGKLVKTGAGTLVLATSNNALGGGVEHNGGTLRLTMPHALGSAAPKLGNFRLVQLDVAGQSAVRLAHGPTAVGTDAYISLDDDGLIVDYNGASPLEAYRALILKSRNESGLWHNAGGIHSNVVLADLAHLRVGFAEASVVFGGKGSFTWRGQSVDTSTLLIAATILGDTNLDLTVDFQDLVKRAQHYNSSGTWSSGDFNFDGVIEFQDLVHLAQNYNGSPLNDSITIGPGESFANDLALAMSLVPEPTAALSAVTLLGSLARRRR